MPDQDISAELRAAARSCANFDDGDYQDVMRRAADEIDRLRGDGWVRCSERLPDHPLQEVMVYGGRFGTGWFDDGWTGTEEVDPAEITHWRPLPPPPSEEGAT